MRFFLVYATIYIVHSDFIICGNLCSKLFFHFDCHRESFLPDQYTLYLMVKYAIIIPFITSVSELISATVKNKKTLLLGINKGLTI